MSRERNYQTEKVWKFPECQDRLVESVAGYSVPLLRLLASRGISGPDEIEVFMSPDYEALSDPFVIPGMQAGVDRFKTAIQNNEKIAIYGDYDVDGVSATALLVSFCKSIGNEPISYIPSRMNEGYGLNNEALDQLKKDGAQLIITVDSGSTSFEEVDYANQIGLSMIVTDHHSLRMSDTGELVLPSAAAVITPKRLSREHALYELAGVAVAFYFVRAIMSSLPEKLSSGQEKWLLDLVALGTICDIVPLRDENRILAYFGLKVLSKSRLEGIRALAAVAEVNLEAVDSYKVGFLLGPRLNAAGRLEHARTALELLITEDSERAAVLAHELNEQNLARQELTERIVNEAKAKIEADGNKKSIYLLSDSEWPSGVVGIVASRLVEEYGKPMLIMEDLGDELKGSARSITELNIIEALSDSGELLTHYGGHAYAAGFKFDKDKFLLLEDRLIKFTDQKVTEKQLIPVVEIDQEIAVAEVDLEFLRLLECLQPFGRDNRKPVFAIMGVRLKDCRLVGNPAVHLKMTVTDGENDISGIAFGFGETVDLEIGGRFDLAVTFEVNEWNQRRKAEFRLIDIRESTA